MGWEHNTNYCTTAVTLTIEFSSIFRVGVSIIHGVSSLNWIFMKHQFYWKKSMTRKSWVALYPLHKEQSQLDNQKILSPFAVGSVKTPISQSFRHFELEHYWSFGTPTQFRWFLTNSQTSLPFSLRNQSRPNNWNVRNAPSGSSSNIEYHPRRRTFGNTDIVCRIFLSLSPGRDNGTRQPKRSAKEFDPVRWLGLSLAPQHLSWLGLSRVRRFCKCLYDIIYTVLVLKLDCPIFGSPCAAGHGVSTWITTSATCAPCRWTTHQSSTCFQQNIEQFKDY